VRRFVVSRGQSFQQSRPLRAKRVAEIDDVEFRLALQGLQDGPVGRHVSERGPRAHLLELENQPPRGVERVALLRHGGERLVASLTGLGGSAEQGLQEVRRELLIAVTVGRSKLVKHPQKVVCFGGVSL